MQRVIVSLLLLLAASGSVLADKRVALVIGNTDYQHTSKLANPTNDASDMAAALKRHGFQVVEGFDLDKPAFDRKVREFAEALEGAATGVLFYAGHGLQVGGHNYLVPVDAKLTSTAALEFEMVRLDVVHRLMERQTLTNVIFLDACRDNPLARNLARAMGTRSSEIGRGLAAVESGVGTLISFSTQPGNVALDGTGRNSPFAAALVKYISTSSDDLSALLIAVRNDVMKETQRKQVPWEHSALTGRFFFNPAVNVPAQPVAPAPRQPSEASGEWSRVDKTSVAELETFVRRHGSSPEADYARARVDDLKKQAALATPAAPPVRGNDKREHAFDGIWEVTTMSGESCPYPGTRREREYAIRISGLKIELSDAAGSKNQISDLAGKVYGQGGNFEFVISRRASDQKRDPGNRNIIRGRLHADSGRGTFQWLRKGTVPGCGGTVLLKKL